MFDKFFRNITYMRVSVTDRCNLRCHYCMPSEGVRLKKSEDILSYEDITNIVLEAAELGISKIRLTGGEPLARKNISRLIGLLKDIPGIKEVMLTTNAHLLSRLAKELKTAGLDRINISLDVLDPEKYRELTGGGEIQSVFEGIEAVIQTGFKNTKINMVIIPGFNDKMVKKMEVFCKEKKLTLQRINHYSLTDRNSPDMKYQAERPLPCDKCNRIRLTSDGKLLPCLFSDMEYPVDLNDISSSIKNAILLKPEQGVCRFTRGNWEIGG